MHFCISFDFLHLNPLKWEKYDILIDNMIQRQTLTLQRGNYGPIGGHEGEEANTAVCAVGKHVFSFKIEMARKSMKMLTSPKNM